MPLRYSRWEAPISSAESETLIRLLLPRTPPGRTRRGQCPSSVATPSPSSSICGDTLGGAGTGGCCARARMGQSAATSATRMAVKQWVLKSISSLQAFRRSGVFRISYSVSDKGELAFDFAGYEIRNTHYALHLNAWSRIDRDDVYHLDACFLGVFVHQHRHHAAGEHAIVRGGEVAVVVEMPHPGIGSLDDDVCRAARKDRHGVETEGRSQRRAIL